MLLFLIKTIGILSIVSSLTGFAVLYLNESLPTKIRVKSGEEETFSFGLPIVASLVNANVLDEEVMIRFDEPVTFVGNQLSSYHLDLQLLGIFPLKQVELEVVEERYLTPIGLPIGIYIETEGVMVVNTGIVEARFGEIYPSDQILMVGDYIIAVDGFPIETKEELIDCIQDSGGEDLLLTINRNGQVFESKITPAETAEGTYKLGIWVKDNAQGIGTMTYIDEMGSFGALGHGIHDIDTGELVHLEEGSIYRTNIIAITKGSTGDPGELTGVIDYRLDFILGDIYQNTDHGIFGTSNYVLQSELRSLEALPIGYKQEVSLGPAQIISTVGEERITYDIEIIELDYQPSEVNKGIKIKITDEALLTETGGIVQGMSGSPIIQDGKIVGAVTHVLVNDPTRGYGIFIENMLESAENIAE